MLRSMSSCLQVLVVLRSKSFYSSTFASRKLLVVLRSRYVFYSSTLANCQILAVLRIKSFYSSTFASR